MNALSPKVEPRHLRLRTRRQYQLAERARQMGWAVPQIEVVDEDLGLSGASSQARTGFQRLVAAIGLGEVGIVLVTEVSRLSRRNSDWHRVIELCAVFRTLIADEDGVYCAHDPNDRLLLGVKGTLFAAELHILHARMRGDPPPLKWSVLRYGFGPEEDRDGEQEAQARGGRGQAAAGGRPGRAGAGGGGGDPRHRGDGGHLLPLAP
jgi:hypothetical protein